MATPSNHQGITLLKPIETQNHSSSPHGETPLPRRGALDGGCNGNIGRQVGAIDLEFATNLKRFVSMGSSEATNVSQDFG